MMPRKIAPSEVRIGDRVLWERGDTEVYGTVVQPAHSVWLCIDELDDALRADQPDTTITLLDRPIPPIPTDEGTVVGNSPRLMTLVRRGDAWWYGDVIYQNDEAGPLDPNEWVLLGEIRP